MRRLATLVLGALILTSGTALAQGRPEISAGWRLLHISGSDVVDGAETDDDGLNVPKGWYFDVAVPITPMLSIVGDIGGNYKSETESLTEQGITFTGSVTSSVHTFLGGIRLGATENPRVNPFAQILFGAARGAASVEATLSGVPLIDFEESATEAAMSLGAGVNLNAGTFGVRIQAEWLKILEEDSGNAFRFAAGIVIPF
ncbi:MAG: hypothetical protein ACRD3G_05770 [Vicinamibacterales bacterium]